jgi:hypothetical protein
MTDRTTLLHKYEITSFDTVAGAVGKIDVNRSSVTGPIWDLTLARFALWPIASPRACCEFRLQGAAKIGVDVVSLLTRNRHAGGVDYERACLRGGAACRWSANWHRRTIRSANRPLRISDGRYGVLFQAQSSRFLTRRLRQAGACATASSIGWDSIFLRTRRADLWRLVLQPDINSGRPRGALRLDRRYR